MMTTGKTSAREKILIIAEYLIENEGYVNISSRAIAKGAKISVGTLYHHFPNGKLDILIAIGEKYGEILKIHEFLADPNADLKEWLRKYLEVSQKKQAFITAMEIEAMSRPEDFIELFNKSIEMNGQEQKSQKTAIMIYKMIVKFAGKKIEPQRVKRLLLVIKTMIRRHVVYKNIFGSNDEFIDLLLKITKALVED